MHLRFKGKAYNNMKSDILQIIIDNAKRVIDSENKELRMIGNLLIEPLGGTTIDVLNITLNLGGTTTIQPTKTVPPSTGLSIPTLFFMMEPSFLFDFDQINLDLNRILLLVTNYPSV